jgi:hypothetical protein
MDTPVLGLVGDIGKTPFFTRRTVTGMQLHLLEIYKVISRLNLKRRSGSIHAKYRGTGSLQPLGYHPAVHS